MPGNYTTIMAKLKAMLTALDDGSGGLTPPKVFGEVHDYGEAEFKNFPAAVILDRAGAGDILDTHRNERQFIFRILLYQEQSVAGDTKAAAATKMRAAVDRVVAMFDENINLDGVVGRVKVVPVSFDFTSRTGTFNFATIDLIATDLVNNYNNN